MIITEIFHRYERPIACLFILLAIGLFIGGSILHLRVGKFEDPDYIYGDAGDGFFNLWAMEHVRTSIIDGDWNLADGRIYWPHNKNTYFWSDNLLIPAAGYSFLRFIRLDIFTAYRWTAILLSALGYLAFIWLFEILFKLTRERRPGIPGWSRIFVILFAYLASFSSSRLIYFVHFQNLSSLWVITMIAGLIGYSRHEKRWYFRISLISLDLLIFSTAYFAITGALLFLAWILLELVRDSRALLITLKNNIWYELTGAAVALPVILGYMSANSPGQPLEYIHRMATKPFHLYLPARGLPRYLYEFFFHRLPAIHHESPAYLGVGLILGIAGLIIWKFPSLARWLGRAIKTPWFWGAASILMIWKLGPAGWKTVNCWSGVIFWLLLLVLFLLGARRRSHTDPVSSPLSYIILCLIIIYGIAIGPRSHFIGSPINPSIWGICAAILPPLTQMRSVGRLAVVGQSLLFALLLVGLLEALGSSRKWLRGAAIVAASLIIILQTADGWMGVAPLHHYNPENIFPRTDEEIWWSEQKGRVAAFPSIPFPLSTREMLYYCGFPDIILLNGYSSHSTPEWDRVMKLGRRWYEPDLRQVTYVEELGADYLAIRKDRVFPEVVETLRKLDRPILFENDRIIVLKANPQPQPPL